MQADRVRSVVWLAPGGGRLSGCSPTPSAGRSQPRTSPCGHSDRWLERAGLPVIRFHDLRRTAATHLPGKGIHPKVVSELLGHSQVGVMLDLYSHVTPTMHREAAKAFDDLLQS